MLLSKRLSTSILQLPGKQRFHFLHLTEFWYLLPPLRILSHLWECFMRFMLNLSCTKKFDFFFVSSNYLFSSLHFLCKNVGGGARRGEMSFLELMPCIASECSWVYSKIILLYCRILEAKRTIQIHFLWFNITMHSKMYSTLVCRCWEKKSILKGDDDDDEEDVKKK